MIYLKEGVKIVDLTGALLHNELTEALVDVEDIFGQHNSPTVITSAWDGKHSANSLHYVGRAVDLRTWYLNDAEETAELLQRLLNRRYGPAFDVVWESDHIHLEYDPRSV